MERLTSLRVVLLTLIICLTALIGCIRKTPPVTFHRLSPMSDSSLSQIALEDISIAVGPVSVPVILDKPNILTFDSRNHARFSEFHRWATPLRDEIAAIIADNLGRLLSTDNILPHNLEDTIKPTIRILVSINRFEGRFNDEVTLDATWSIRKSGSNQPDVVRRSIVRIPLSTQEYDDLVASQGKALAELSREMAATILDLAGE